MPFIPHTDQDVQKMLDVIGIDKIDDLFDEIPPHLLCKPLTGVPEGRSEMEMLRLMSERAEADAGALSFIGAGAYEHHIPAAVWDITTRGEFMTAYTPYQAEASQGTLQLIYEYQSMMCALTGLDASNASLYDGGSGLGEAILMAVRANRKSKSKKVLLAGSLHPLYVKAAETLVKNQGIQFDTLSFSEETMTIDAASLASYAEQDYAALVIAQPNFFGALESVDLMTDWAHENGALVIGVVNPTSLALLKAPGQWGGQGADIAVGEGQPLGIPLASGGPYFGFICCKEKLVRQMPGRIIGKTIDLEGKPGYTLTLQAREQHIRRSKATSNICTNQGLAVTAATIYMSLLGFEGLKRVASHCHANATNLKQKLSQLDDVEVQSVQGMFHEFVYQTSKPADQVLNKLADLDVLGGIALRPYFPELPNAILVCATEVKTEADLVHYQEALKTVLAEEQL